MPAMRILALPVLLLAAALACAADWTAVAPGIDYLRIERDGIDVHLVGVNLDEPSLAVVATAPAERGLTVSEFATQRRAVVAINADYFDEALQPVGFAMGGGAVWARADDRVRRQEVIGVGGRRVEIFARADPLREPQPWMTGAVSGWPAIVADCGPVAALPGSDFFTRAPHPRTAVGLSHDGRRMLLLVADGRREGVPGLTLRELAELLAWYGACTAVNLDGGGSSALWLRDRIVNRPSDGVERRAANHLGVVIAEE
jgi:exopolysaccharide biosynthesis protein